MLRLDVFHGDANPTAARVYARVRGEDPAELANLTISGTIYGPHCKYSRTLPAWVEFRDLGNNLAEAILPDPCFWTPDSPFTYRVVLAVRRGDEVILSQQRLFGIRPLGTRGKDLILAGKRWVLRAAFQWSSRQAHELSWSASHDAGLAMLTNSLLTESRCREASVTGVFLVPMISPAKSTESDVAAWLAELSGWPAVGIIILGGPWTVEYVSRVRPPNLLVGTLNAEGAPGADIVFGFVDEPASFAERFKATDKPVVAIRSGTGFTSPDEARRACDQLQRDLAPHGDFAGYIAMKEVFPFDR